jgi:serine/threonine protein kinase
MIDKTITHFRILGKLGEGGMGVVYKAQDLKLDRTVALKFLPSHVAVNEETKARFLQEAKAAASLNHPNICTIYGVEESSPAEGSGDEKETQMFIAMEYVDGGTLREKLPFPKIDEAISVAIQIAEALQEAHSKGIVHRDIKADNIMLTSKGQAKVMDFGLAKLKGSLKLTKTSSTVGTLGYMAPEQIQGGEVDHRSDIFSFGVLVFEMLTGKLPFRGEHEAAMVYSIVNEEPEPIQKFLPDVSPEIAHALSKALEKDPENRYQSMQDLIVDLRRSKRDSSRVSRTTRTIQSQEYAPQQPIAEAKAPSSRILRVLGFAAIPVILLAVGYFVFFRSGVELNNAMRFRKLQIPFSQVSYPSLSADGNWTAFAAADLNGKWDVYYMHTSEGGAKRVTNDSSVFIQQMADISPDGSKIVYNLPNLAERRIDAAVVSVLGGTAKIVAQGSQLQRWRPDGKRIGYIQLKNRKNAYYSFWSVNADGSDNKRVFTDTLTLLGRFSFCWSPDGNSIAWIRTFPGAIQEIIIRNLTNGSEKQITTEKANIDDLCWLQNGMILYSTNKNGNSNVWMIPQNGGSSQQVTKGTSTDLGIRSSADGNTVLYYQQQRIGKIWIGDLKSRVGTQVTFDDRGIEEASIDPGGSTLAFTMNAKDDEMTPGNELFLMDRHGANRQQVTNGKHTLGNARWSPDGKRIAFIERQLNESPDSAQLVILDLSAPNTPRRLLRGLAGFQWVDDKTILTRMQASTRSSLFNIATEALVPFYEDSTNAMPVDGGRLIFFGDSRNAKAGPFVRSAEYSTSPDKFPARRFLSDEILSSIVWAGPVDQYLYFRDRINRFYRKSFTTGSTEDLSGNYSGLDLLSSVTVSTNNNEFVYVPHQNNGKLILIENLFR